MRIYVNVHNINRQMNLLLNHLYSFLAPLNRIFFSTSMIGVSNPYAWGNIICNKLLYFKNILLQYTMITFLGSPSSSVKPKIHFPLNYSVDPIIMRLQIAFQVEFQLIWVKFRHRDLESKTLWFTAGFYFLTSPYISYTYVLCLVDGFCLTH